VPPITIAVTYYVLSASLKGWLSQINLQNPEEGESCGEGVNISVVVIAGSQSYVNAGANLLPSLSQAMSVVIHSTESGALLWVQQ
jgi:hypothetical protein